MYMFSVYESQSFEHNFAQFFFTKFFNLNVSISYNLDKVWYYTSESD